MAAVTRLVTVVDIDDRAVRADAPVTDDPAPEGFEPAVAPASPAPDPDDPREMALSALHLAVLDDGRRLILLDDRGWGVHGPPGIWPRTPVEEIEADARMVVGPDEPHGSHSQADMEADHWAYLSGILRQQGVLVDAEELNRLPHDVELSERLRTRNHQYLTAPPDQHPSDRSANSVARVHCSPSGLGQSTVPVRPSHYMLSVDESDWRWTWWHTRVPSFGARHPIRGLHPAAGPVRVARYGALGYSNRHWRTAMHRFVLPKWRRGTPKDGLEGELDD